MKKIIALVALTVWSFTALAGQYPDITVSELKSAIAAKKVTLIDVNGKESWEKGHIPGALEFSSAEKNLAKVLPADKNALIVAYCGGPKCNAYQAAAKAAEKLGYKNVKHLSAGISGWKAAGEPVQKPG